MSRYTIAGPQGTVKPILSEAYYEEYYARVPVDKHVSEEEPIADREENVAVTEPHQYTPFVRLDDQHQASSSVARIPSTRY
ncbi:hypothetical protein QC761_0054330 [Podospora bellae-mahoneyi]|uniref:Uncharacterized protein n=1 Tax=Podospora bellae-mahoneyi TaxID=2093777 RepID=A0ABR0FKU4_9PEZI|nr:hypothetical protein QC761_0054330 [Podospora bellae-mahoneyi]